MSIITNDLKWVAEVDNNAADWVTVVPSNGMGDTNVSINVSNSDVWADPNTLSGTVTFRCTNCEKERSKKINVCRCACFCDDLNITRTVSGTIGEEGLPAGTIIGTYSLTNNCNNNAVSAILRNNRTELETPLKCENGYIKLISAIPYNQIMENVNYTVNAYFDREHNTENPCIGKNFSFEQKALECTCESAVKNHITFSNYFNGASQIPQSGLAVGTVLFTYNLKQYCPDSRTNYGTVEVSGLEAEIKYGSTTRIVNISNGIAVLGERIGANNTDSERNITLSIKYNNNSTCLSAATTQIPCNCNTVFNDNSFVVNLTSFGYKVGDIIGSYSKKTITCPDNKITASLSRNGVEYPLSCTDGNVILSGENDIVENMTKNPISFTLTVGYGNNANCDTHTIQQNGVDCNCDDIYGKISFFDSFKEIPKTGLSTNTIVGEYRLTNNKCSDDNDCLRVVDKRDATIDENGIVTIDEYSNNIKFILSDNKIKLLKSIDDNDDIKKINYSFYVLYNINGKWRKCGDELTGYTQNGIECSCQSIRVHPDGRSSWEEFPYAGTHGQWVMFASGNTALYKENGDFIGVCGKLNASCDSYYLLEDTEQNVPNRVSDIGNKIRVIGIPLSESETAIVNENQGAEYAVPYIYYFYVNIKKIEGTTDILTLVANLYFSQYDEEEESWVVTECVDRIVGFKITGNACDCDSKPNLLTSYVQCEGTNGVRELGYLSNSYSTIHSAMTISAELLNPDSENTLIKDFSYSYVNYRLGVSGSVAEHGTSEERVVGTIRVNYVCNKNKSNEWYCGYKDYNITQLNCPVCDCNYIVDNYLYTSTPIIELPFNGRYVIDRITRDAELDCGEFYIEGQDEETGIYEGEWYTAYLRKEYYYYGYYYNAVINLKDGVEHDNRDEYLPNIHVKIYNEEESAYTECNTFKVRIVDKKCDCTSIDNISTASTIQISNCDRYGYTWLGSQIIKNCVKYYIIRDDGTKYYDSTSTAYGYTYRHPTSDIELFDVRLYRSEGSYMDGNIEVDVKLKNDLDASYVFTIHGEYINSSGETVECDKEINITVRQILPTCNDFIRKVSIAYTNFTQHDTNDIFICYLTSTYCGTGTLYVFDGEGNGYSDANDIPSDSDINYVKNIYSSIDYNMSRQYFYISLDNLQEGESRQIHMALCKNDSNGEPIINETTNTCVCSKEFDIYQNYVYDCYDVSCSDYDTGINDSILDEHGNYKYTISKNDGLKEIVAYNKLPENYSNCYRLSITCQNENVKTFQYGVDSETYGGKYAIKLELTNEKEPTIGGIISVDIDVYYQGSRCPNKDKHLQIRIVE